MALLKKEALIKVALGLSSNGSPLWNRTNNHKHLCFKSMRIVFCGFIATRIVFIIFSD